MDLEKEEQAKVSASVWKEIKLAVEIKWIRKNSENQWNQTLLLIDRIEKP